MLDIQRVFTESNSGFEKLSMALQGGIKETLMQLQKLFGLIVLLLVADQEFQRLIFCITTSMNYLGENCHAKPSEAISAF